MERHQVEWTSYLTPQALIDLVASRSYCITSPAKVRSQTLDEVRELLATHPALANSTGLALPYVTVCIRATLGRLTGFAVIGCAEPPLQRGAQSLLLGGLEGVGGPGDIAVGPNQHRAQRIVRRRRDDGVHPVSPSARCIGHLPAGKVQQHRPGRVQQVRGATAVGQTRSGTNSPASGWSSPTS